MVVCKLLRCLPTSSLEWFQAPACERPLWLADMLNIGLSIQTAASKHQNTILDKSLVCCLLLVCCELSVGCSCSLLEESTLPVEFWLFVDH